MGQETIDIHVDATTHGRVNRGLAAPSKPVQRQLGIGPMRQLHIADLIRLVDHCPS